MSTSPEMLWTPEEDALLKEKYATCDSIKEVMPFFPKRTYDALRSRAKDYLEVQMKVPLLHDVTYFDTPTEENCSVAGFLAADGHVSDIGRLTVNLASKDKSHLETITRLLRFTGRVYDYVNHRKLTAEGKGNKKGTFRAYEGDYSVSTIQIACPTLCTKLREHWNIVPRKSHTLLPPNLIDTRLVLAFISGFVDGDGWITEDMSWKYPQYSIGAMGTKEVIEWVKYHVDTIVPTVQSGKLRPTGSDNIYDIRLSGVRVYWLAKMFLSMDIPRLERKWCKLRRLIESVETGTASQRFKSQVLRFCPSDSVLEEFGLMDTKKHLLATIRPSVV